MATPQSPSITPIESVHQSNPISEPLPPSLLFFITNVHNLIPIKLNHHNYTLWKLQCQGALKATSLIQHLQHSQPPPQTITGPAGHPVPNPLYPKWVLSDSFVVSCLISTLTPEIFVQVKGFNTVFDLWKFLEQKFSLYHKLVSHRKKPDQTVGDFLKEILEIAEQLAEAGAPVSKGELIEHSLNGLPRGFDSVKEVIRGLSLGSCIEDIHMRIVSECDKLESKCLDYQMGKSISKRRRKTILGAVKIVRKRRKCMSEMTSSGLELTPSKFSCGDHLSGVTPYQPISVNAFGTAKSLNTTTAESWSPSNQWNAASHLPPGLLNSNKGFGASSPNDECCGAAGGLSVSAADTGFGKGPVSPGFQRDIEKERMGIEISCEETSHDHKDLVDKEVMAEVMSERETDIHRAEDFQGFAAFSSSTPSQSTGDLSPPISLEFLQSDTPFNSTTTSESWSPSDERNSTCQLPSNLNSNKGFGASPNEADGHGTTILNEPKLGVLDQANSRFLNDTAALSFEERILLSDEEKMGYQAPQGSGNLQRSPFHGFQGSCGPQISQRMPFQGFRGSSGPQISQGKPESIRFGPKTGSVSPQTVVNLPDFELKYFVESARQKVCELSTGIADVKTPSSQKKKGQVQQVKEQLIGADIMQNDDLCQIGTETKEADG